MRNFAFYETGFYSVTTCYLSRPYAVAVTNLQVNADYARYLEFLNPNKQKQPAATVEKEPIYPPTPLPSGP